MGCWNADGTPNKYNFRYECNKVMEAYKDEVPMFGLEQEYTLMSLQDWPVGWPTGFFPAPQGPYYCGVGAGKVVERDIVEAHYKACLYAGINISGTNAEVMPAQWEFQVGPVTGIDMGDQLWAARGEVEGKKGMAVIEELIKKLEPHHLECIKEYGDDNDLRLTGRHETGSIDKFSWGVADRGGSIRVPREVAAEGQGYFEDRRPASNADPYRVTKVLMTSMFGKL